MLSKTKVNVKMNFVQNLFVSNSGKPNVHWGKTNGLSFTYSSDIIGVIYTVLLPKYWGILFTEGVTDFCKGHIRKIIFKRVLFVFTQLHV